MTHVDINKQLFLTSLLIIGAFLLFEMSPLDILIQDMFYNFQTQTWMLERENTLLKFLFYDGMKKLLIFFGVLCLLALLGSFYIQRLKKYTKGLTIVVLSAILIPTFIGVLKTLTNTPCPKNISHYHGDYPDISVCGSYPKDFIQEEKIRCWPAGHASGGFALLSLFFLFQSKKNKKRALLLALAVGWSMGAYKMLIGDHFLSHTLFSMLFAWLLILLIAKMLKYDLHNIRTNS